MWVANNKVRTAIPQIVSPYFLLPTDTIKISSKYTIVIPLAIPCWSVCYYEIPCYDTYYTVQVYFVLEVRNKEQSKK